MFQCSEDFVIHERYIFEYSKQKKHFMRYLQKPFFAHFYLSKFSFREKKVGNIKTYHHPASFFNFHKGFQIFIICILRKIKIYVHKMKKTDINSISLVRYTATLASEISHYFQNWHILICIHLSIYLENKLKGKCANIPMQISIKINRMNTRFFFRIDKCLE